MALFNAGDFPHEPTAPSMPFQFMPSPQRLDTSNFHVYWPGVEGAQGYADARAAHMDPWPYTTGFKQFLWPGRYGSASTLAAAGAHNNLWAGALAFRPLGYEKPFTGSYSSF